MKRAAALVVALALAGLACPSATPAAPPRDAATKRVLVFTKWIVFHHVSIDAGAQALKDLGGELGIQVDVTDDAGAFTDDNLLGYAAVAFVSTTVENDRLHPFDAADAGLSGDFQRTIMTADQKAAFERFIGRGGGYVGIHAASDGDYFWPFYVDMLGAMFTDHATPGSFQTATLIVEDPSHPSTLALPSPWSRAEEWYDFDRNPRDVARVLLTLDESTYRDGPKGCTRDHPIAWCRDYKGARVFYTAVGHLPEYFAEPMVRAHLRGALQWATRLADADCSPRPAPATLPAGNAACGATPCFTGCACGGASECRRVSGHERRPAPDCGGVWCDPGCHCADASKNTCTCP